MSLEPRYVCSIDIGGTKIASALLKFDGADVMPEIVFEDATPTLAAEGGEAVYARIEAAAKKVIERSPAPVAGIGVGSAGVVDHRTGIIAYANDIMPGWGGIELGPRLAAACGVPTAVMGDVHAHALGEARWGAGRGRESMLCLGIGTGIGGAFVVDGKVLRGFHGAAGHMGHVESAAAAGMPCACGRSSHIESVASGTSIGRVFEDRFGRIDPKRPVTGFDVNELSVAGDERAREVVYNSGFALGATLGSLCNILDPEVIVLSGGVVHGIVGWTDAIADGFKSQALDPLLNTPIETGTLEGIAPLIGAAENLLDSLN